MSYSGELWRIRKYKSDEFVSYMKNVIFLTKHQEVFAYIS